MLNHMLAGWEWTAEAATPLPTKEKSAEAIVPAGKKDELGRAERTSEGPLTNLWKKR
jgi:hypothetical protein